MDKKLEHKAQSQEELDFQEALATGETSSSSQIDPEWNGGMTVAGIYWLTLILLVICGAGLTLIFGQQNRPLDSKLTGVVCVLVLVLPGIQFLASGITLLILAMGGGRGEFAEKKHQLDKLTFGTIIGTVIGLIIMGFAWIILLNVK